MKETLNKSIVVPVAVAPALFVKGKVSQNLKSSEMNRRAELILGEKDKGVFVGLEQSSKNGTKFEAGARLELKTRSMLGIRFFTGIKGSVNIKIED